MKKIEVYYHLYIPFNDAAGFCTWWMDSVLQKIKNSGLQSVSKVNIAITMPMHISSTGDGVPVISMRTRHRCSFAYAVEEYINYRYPWVNILDIRDVSEANLYEGQTLELMHRTCSSDALVLYIHSKGIFSASFNVSAWREVLEHYMINEWRECTSKLDNYDLITVKDTHIINSGNVYWARGEYIKSLDSPLESQNYLPPEKSDMYPNEPLFRYAFELWITSKNPRIDTIHNIECNPYHEYWFLERTLDK